MEKASEIVRPLTSNKFLQKEFISILLKKSKGDLKKLTNEVGLIVLILIYNYYYAFQLQALHKRFNLDYGSNQNQSEISSFPQLFAQLATPSPQTLDQVKALTIATEAFRGIVLY